MTKIENICAGVLFDFAGFLTTLTEPVTLGAAFDASVAGDLLDTFAESRGLSLADPDVTHWQDALRSSQRPERRFFSAQLLQDGEKLSRHAWDFDTGEQTFIVLVFGNTVAAEGSAFVGALHVGRVVKCAPRIDKCVVSQSGVVHTSAWQASNDDLLADYWYVVSN